MNAIMADFDANNTEDKVNIDEDHLSSKIIVMHTSTFEDQEDDNKKLIYGLIASEELHLFHLFIEAVPNVQLICSLLTLNLVHYDNKIVLLNNDLLFYPTGDSWSAHKGQRESMRP